MTHEKKYIIEQLDSMKLQQTLKVGTTPRQPANLIPPELFWGFTFCFANWTFLGAVNHCGLEGVCKRGRSLYYALLFQDTRFNPECSLSDMASEGPVGLGASGLSPISAK